MNKKTKAIKKSGDDGTTDDGKGLRVSKSSPRVQAIGDIDELNCVIGMSITTWSSDIDYVMPKDLVLVKVQHRLIDIINELNFADFSINDNDVNLVGDEADLVNRSLSSTILPTLPAGNELVVRLHHSRAVARRAERSLVALSNIEQDVNPMSLQYLNRLSDYLFVLARHFTFRREILWQPKESPNLEVHPTA